MNARLLKNNDGIWLLYSNGYMESMKESSDLRNFLFHFKGINRYKPEQMQKREAKLWNIEYPEMSSYPGETIAYVTDSFQLVIVDFEPFNCLFNETVSTLDDLLSVPEYARLYGKSVEQIKVFCRTGRIPGAKKIGRDWVIPNGSPYPFDNRITSGKYLKK